MPQLKREEHFQSLERLYSELDEALPSASGNACGRCRECCTRRGASRHNVTALELELIAERVGEERLPAFESYLGRADGVEVCPYFDEERWGCGIYGVRPFSCRVFGHYRAESTRLPEVCVFTGQEKLFGVERYLQDVPKAAELKELARSFWAYQRPTRAESAERAVTEGSGGEHEPWQGAEGDALDRALVLMAQGQLQQALSEFEASDLPSTPYVLYCLSLVFEGLERYSDAITALTAALQQAPECAPLWFRLGCSLYTTGQTQSALKAFEKTLAHDPEHATAHALLGSHCLQHRELEKARTHLEASWKLRPDAKVEAWLRLLGQKLMG